MLASAETGSTVFWSTGEPPMIPFTSSAGSAVVRRRNSSAARGSAGRAPASASISGPGTSSAQAATSSSVGAAIPARNASGRRPSRGCTAARICVSACIAFSAAPPKIPECRSRSPVRTVTWK